MTRINEMVIRLAAWAQASKDEDGQGMAEYGLILALVAVVVAGALATLQGGISGTLGQVTSKLGGS
jgi:pilus assembly protein Flp/PilA